MPYLDDAPGRTRSAGHRGGACSSGGQRGLRRRTTHGNLFTIRPDGTDLQQLTHYNGLTKMSVGSYSPDGKAIVFGMVVRAVNRPHATLNDVFVMNAVGSHVRPVTRNKRWVGSPDWGPQQ